MLYLNVKRVMRLRGVDNHYELMMKLGFISSTARKFMNGEMVLIKLEQIEALCLALNCTPNDLLEWKPNASQNVSENHSLNNLKRAGEKDLPKLMNELSVDKLEKLIEILHEEKDAA